MGLSVDLLVLPVTDIEVRYHEKIRRAREIYEKRFAVMPDRNRDDLLSSLTQVAVADVRGLVGRQKCPACDNPGFVAGRDYLGDYGAWFASRMFGCRVCELQLVEPELKFAGIGGQPMNWREPDPDFEPDF